MEIFFNFFFYIFPAAYDKSLARELRWNILAAVHRSVMFSGLVFHGQFDSIKWSSAEKDHLWQRSGVNHKHEPATVEWFHWSQPTGGGQRSELLRPTRAETVNTTMTPALLSGTNRRRGPCSGHTHLSVPSSFPCRAEKLSLVSRFGVMCVRILDPEFNYCSLLAAPVIFLFQSRALGAGQCHTLFSPKWFLLWAASESHQLNTAPQQIWIRSVHEFIISP